MYITVADWLFILEGISRLLSAFFLLLRNDSIILSALDGSFWMKFIKLNSTKAAKNLICCYFLLIYFTFHLKHLKYPLCVPILQPISEPESYIFLFFKIMKICQFGLAEPSSLGLLICRRVHNNLIFF